MKFIFAFGLISVCLHFSIAEIIPLKSEVFPKKSAPSYGKCFLNTEIMCTTEGMSVQSDKGSCLKCSCNGDLQGATCCDVNPFPIVGDHCFSRLNTDTCSYELTPKVAHARPACCRIQGYYAANLDDRRVPWKVAEELEKADV